MKVRKNTVDLVRRGSCCLSDSRRMRLSFRLRDEPEDRHWYGGFRLVIRRKA